MNITHTDCIRYLRQLGSELHARAVRLEDADHPMAAFFVAESDKANASIEAVVTLLVQRMHEQDDAARAEWESRQPVRSRGDREDFRSDEGYGA